jgi:hypothetical protein
MRETGHRDRRATAIEATALANAHGVGRISTTGS